MAGICRAALVALAVSVAALGGFAKAADPDAAAEGAPPLQIYAVPALADALREVAIAGACPRTALPEFVLAEAVTLVQQIERGARADVLAIDDAAAIERLAAQARIGTPHRFATVATSQTASVSYWIAPLLDARRPTGASDFIDRLLPAGGQGRLGDPSGGAARGR